MLLLASVTSAVGDVYSRPETITADLGKSERLRSDYVNQGEFIQILAISINFSK